MHPGCICVHVLPCPVFPLTHKDHNYYAYCTYEGKVCVCDTSQLILLEGVNTATTNFTKAVNNTMWLALGTYELL